MPPNENLSRPRNRWERACVLFAVLASLALGLSSLDGPCLWHDELVHVYVAKHIAAHGWPALPSGEFYPSSMAYNYLLAASVALFGDGAIAVRAPSALLGAFNVWLTCLLARKLAGRNVALLAALALALSPWHVAWSRQARMYTMQETAYLLAMYWAWGAFETASTRIAWKNALGALAAYVLGLFTSFHSILFLGTAGGYALARGCLDRAWRGRAFAAAFFCGVIGLGALAALGINPNKADQQAIFVTGLGGTLVDPQRADRFFYFHWLNNNLGSGFFLLMLLGTALLVWREKRQGAFAAWAFWAPALILTFLIGYRRERFLFFAFPFYGILFSYALACLIQHMLRFRKSLWNGLAAAAILVFVCRMGISAAHLLQDSLRTAQGTHLTLAKKHPQWEKPADYIRAHRTNEALLTTTYLNALYYAGPVDDWFPNRYQWWESQESGLKGLGSLAELQAFVKDHPRGYYIAEWERFEKWQGHTHLKDLAEEAAWIRAHMIRIDEACSEDVTLYAWGQAGQ